MPPSPLLVWAMSLVQAMAPAPVADPEPVASRVMAVAGAHTSGDGVHPYAGLEGGWHLDRIGARGVAMYGRGNGFSSVLAGGGPSLRHPLRDGLAVVAWAGGGWYREGRSPGISRSLPVLMGGASIHFPAGPVRLSAGATALAGSHSSGDAPASHPVRSVRFAIGVGR
jgi:hypothetical protein